MTYPPSSPGYPPSQQPTTQFSAPTQQFSKVEQQPSAQGPAAAAGPSKLPFILLAAVAVLGLLVYLFSFGPQFAIDNTDFPQLGSASGTSLGLGLAVVASLVSALIAAASVLPRQKAPVGVIAAVGVLAFLLVLAEIIQKPEGVSIGWALYVVIALTFLQAALAVGALLLDAGIISAPVPKPKYEQPQYGQYGGPNQYYGQHAPHQGGAPQQRQPYPGQYGGGYSGGSSSGGWLRRDRPAGRPADPADRFPDLRPAAGNAVRAGRRRFPQSQPQSSSSSSSNQSGNSPS